MYIDVYNVYPMFRLTHITSYYQLLTQEIMKFPTCSMDHSGHDLRISADRNQLRLRHAAACYDSAVGKEKSINEHRIPPKKDKFWGV